MNNYYDIIHLFLLENNLNDKIEKWRDCMKDFSNTTQYSIIPVILGSNVNSLGTLRALGKEGILSFIVAEKEGVASHSKYKLDYSFKTTGILNQLRELGKCLEEKGQKGFLIPTSDRYTMEVVKYKEILEKYYIILSEGSEVLNLCINKSEIYPILDELKIDYPKSAHINKAEEIHKVDELKYPLLIKPENTIGFSDRFEKATILYSPQEISEFIVKLKEKGLDQRKLLVQEWIPGEDTNLHSYLSYSKEGQIYGDAQCYKLRQYPPGAGTITAGVFTKNERVEDIGRKIIKRLGYSGIQGMEFKYDKRDDQYKFIEINPRTWLSISAMADIGVNIVYMAYLHALGEKPTVKNLPEDKSLLWILDFEDFIRTVYSNRKRYPKSALSYRGWKKSIRMPKAFAIFDKKDIHPWLYKIKTLIV